MLTTQRRDRRVRRQARFRLESLDDRLVLSAGAGGAAAEAMVQYPADNHAHIAHLHHHTNYPRLRAARGHRPPAALPANVSPALRSLHREYENQGGSSVLPVIPSGGPLLISESRVVVRIKAAFPPALDAYLPKLRADGLQVIRTMPAYGVVEGLLPIAELPAVAHDAAWVRPAHWPIMGQLHPDTR
jgi:hypothetical protein